MNKTKISQSDLELNFLKKINHLTSEITVDKEKKFHLDSYVYEKIKLFPKTRFYGSKKRLLSWIYENIKELEFNTVLDGFGGTSSVSLLFKAMKKNLTYNDILNSNTISANTLLLSEIPISLVNAEKFIESISPKKGIVYKNFHNVFFNDEENMWIDGAMENILSLSNVKQRNLFLYCLFQSCLMKRPFNIFHRANLNLRTNKEIKRSFGNLTTWNTSFEILMKKNLLEIYRFIWDSNTKTKVLKSKSIEKIEKGYDLVYLDPPYISKINNTDGYLKKYHFLEGLSDYNNWENMIDYNSSIKMLSSHKYNSDWENKYKFKEKLFNLISYHKSSIVVLSYVNNAVPSIKELMDFFEDNFSKVTINTYSLSHALAKDKRNEILIIGEP
ncbi:DNA adenine methylase [Aliarcobacter butzleri]|uniref:DNA adenine methylase n=1 Tax=Aliarcobacter butzleri TaxID=28197 RepID=UPI0024DEA719|nr:DNA adenine methylase [Aliarcobacter butzleri]MDK2082615.1 DNA adenine methylase [Aliarcobacter butzleri]